LKEKTMFRKYLVPLLAVVGVVFAIMRVADMNKPLRAALPVAQPAQADFASRVSGTGLIEARTENVTIGAMTAGVVTKVFVRPSDRVRVGDPLFKVDDRALQAELLVRQTALATAKEQLARLVSLPRPEDVPVAEARVQEAQANLGDLKSQLALWESITDRRAVSADELSQRRFAVRIAEAKLRQAQASLDLLKAGSWRPEIAVAQAEVAAAEAQVQAVQTDIERLTTRAPMDGEILQVNVRAGEYAPAGALQTPLMLMGNVDELHIRVDIDENDAWRVRPEAPAVAFVRGNRDLRTPLEFGWIEPYVVPKRSLTGDSMERVDTRVLRVVYRFRRGNLPVYVGQQMDVFIEAPPAGASSAPATSRE
jgi:multidrug resistance efflux pump